MSRCIQMALMTSALLVAGGAALAQDADSRKPLGTWVHHTDEYKVTFDVKPDTLRCTISGDGGLSISVTADYVVSPDGILFGVIRTRKADKKKGEEADTEKRLFYCRFAIEKNGLVLSDVAYGDDKDKIKEVLEGKYRKMEKKSSAASPAITVAPATTQSYKPRTKTSSSPKTSGDPNRRLSELLKQSEDLRKIEYDWERVWFIDQPSHRTPERVHGGIE
jgi:hypothetical protein